MERSTDRILTTHDGSLARPTELLDLLRGHRCVDGPVAERQACPGESSQCC